MITAFFAFLVAGAAFTTGSHSRVYAADDISGDRTLKFEGSLEQADQWVEQRRATARDTTLPFVTIVVGLLVTGDAVGLGWRHTVERRHFGTSHGHLAT